MADERIIHGIDVKGGGADTIVQGACLELHPVLVEVTTDREAYERAVEAIYRSLYRAVWAAVGLPIAWDVPQLPEEG